MLNKFVFILCVFTAFIAKAQTPNIVLTQVVSGLSQPVAISQCGDERLFVVEQFGNIKIIKNGSLLSSPFLNIGSLTAAGGERGLLGLAFAPDYATTRNFYISYTNTSGTSTIARYQVSANNPDSALLSSGQIILTQSQPYSNHNGGNLAFGPDGYLYIGLGDGGSANDPQGNGQNKMVKLGKMLRIDVAGSATYTVPATNPFVGNAAYLPEIWATGLRNPWRYSFDKLTGDLWIADVGQDVWEEIDMQPASSTGGENYGWRCYEGNSSFNTSGCGAASNYVAPVHVRQHGGTYGDCSITGGFIYRGAKHANLYGNYIFADYCSSNLYMLSKNSSGNYVPTVLKNNTNTPWTAFGQDIYGELYVADYSNGKIFAISDTSTCLPVANFNLPSTYATCDSTMLLSTPYNPGMIYQWSLNGVTIAGADSSVYLANTDGDYTVTVANFINGCIAVSDTTTIDFGVTITASLTGLDTLYCVNAPTVVLTGTPAGGTFSGPGVTGNVFDPTAAGVGAQTITYSYMANGCSATAQTSTTISACTGIDNIANTAAIHVVPNPSNGTFSINFANNLNEKIEVTVQNYLGQRVYQSTQNATLGNNSISIKMDEAKPGLYLLSVKKSSGITKMQVLVD